MIPNSKVGQIDQLFEEMPFAFPPLPEIPSWFSLFFVPMLSKSHKNSRFKSCFSRRSGNRREIDKIIILEMPRFRYEKVGQSSENSECWQTFHFSTMERGFLR
jgi:hypothetical protein